MHATCKASFLFMDKIHWGEIISELRSRILLFYCKCKYLLKINAKAVEGRVPNIGAALPVKNNVDYTNYTYSFHLFFS